MKKAERSPTRWYAAWRSRPVAPAHPDPADCGTAFGLDLSIPGDETPPRAAAPAPTGWRARWAWRRRAA
jgi:hypothetical protein